MWRLIFTEGFELQVKKTSLSIFFLFILPLTDQSPFKGIDGIY